MTKYRPIQAHLERQSMSELPMRFSEIEQILGFALPPSARRYPAWWSNNEGSHVAVQAWRNAGYRTSRVDVPGERLVFVRDSARPTPGVAEAAASFQRQSESQGRRLRLDEHQLPPSTWRMLEEMTHERGEDLSAAAAEVLKQAAVQHRRSIFDWFEQNTRRSEVTSAELIREDRDGR